MMRRLLAIFVALIGISAMANAKCKFTLNEAGAETRIVAIERNGQLELLREDSVDVGTTLHFMCSRKKVAKVTCNGKNKFSRKLPIRDCADQPKAVIEKIPDATCSAETYRVGYKIGNSFLELYRSCYKRSEMRALVTTHHAYPYSLVTHRPNVSFTGDGIVNMNDAASFETKSIYERFELLFNRSQSYVKSQTDRIIDRGHLTPSADYLFPTHMRATFKYINAIPQFSSINIGNWKSIEDWIRKYVKASGSARIMTGAFDVLALAKKPNAQIPIYLQAGQRNPIPKWIYKVIYGQRETIIFLTSNNNYSPQDETVNCKKIPCPLQLKNATESGLTVCLDPQDFHQKLWPHIH